MSIARHTTATQGTNVMTGRSPVTITPKLIKETIDNWDVKACGQRMYLAVIEEEKTQGGIYLPETHQDVQHDAVVIACGPMAIINDQEPRGRDGEILSDIEKQWLSTEDLECATRRFLQPNDRVTISKWSGEEIHRRCTVKGGLQKLMIVNDLDAIGIPKE